jgi:hypothetical protein
MAVDNNDDDSKVILKLREGEDYDGSFWFCPSEVRDPPPTFRYAIAHTLTPAGNNS